MLKCGFFETDITPPIGSSMPGGFADRISTSIKDNLAAHVFAVTDGNKTVIIISLDAIAIYSEDVEVIRNKISSVTKVSPSDIFVAATHTHTAGPVINLYETKRSQEYMNYLNSKAADAAVTAFNKMVPAKIGCDVVGVRGIAFNRRWIMANGKARMNPPFDDPALVAPADITDPDFTVVRVDHEDGTPMGIITNFALHPAGLPGTEISANYPGYMKKLIKNHYGYDFGFVFLTGCCGNINFTDFAHSQRHSYDEPGTALAEAAIKLYDTIITSGDCSIKSTSEYVTADIRVPTEKELEAAKNPIQREMRIGMEMGGGQVECEVQTISIGDLSITGLPGEIFCVFGLHIKMGSPFKYNIVSELTNGSNGYIYTREARQLGGYEALPSSYIRLDEETGYKFVNTAIKNLRSMK